MRSHGYNFKTNDFTLCFCKLNEIFLILFFLLFKRLCHCWAKDTRLMNRFYELQSRNIFLFIYILYDKHTHMYYQIDVGCQLVFWSPFLDIFSKLVCPKLFCFCHAHYPVILIMLYFNDCNYVHLQMFA